MGSPDYNSMSDADLDSAVLENHFNSLSEKELDRAVEQHISTKPEMGGADKLMFYTRGALEGHTLGISEPIISAAKAGYQSLVKGKSFSDAYSNDVKQRAEDVKNNQKSHIAAQIAGALAPSPVNVAGKLIGGAVKGAKALGLTGWLARGAFIGATSSGAGQAIKELAEDPSGFQDTKGAPGRIAMATGTGALLGPLVEYVGGKGNQSQNEAAVTPGVGEPTIRGTPGTAEDLLKLKQGGLKANHAEITKAAEDLGTKPTPGMLTNDNSLQRTEQMLNQTPLSGAASVKKSISDVHDASQKAAESLVAGQSSLSSTTMGGKIQEGLVSEVRKVVEPAEQIYQSLEAPLSQTKAYFNNTQDALFKLHGQAKTSDEVAAVINKVNRYIHNSESVGDLKGFRTSILSDLSQDISPIERSALTSISKGLAADRDYSILKNSAQAGFNPKVVQDSLNAANHHYRQAYQMIEDSLPKGLNSYGPSEFASKMTDNSVNTTTLPEKFFSPGNVKQAQAAQRNFPEQFDQARQSFLGDLSSGATQHGTINPNALVKKIQGLEPEVQKLLLGDQYQKFKSLKTVSDAMPRLKDSGTPEGSAVMNFVNDWLKIGPLKTSAQTMMFNSKANNLMNPGVPSAAARRLNVAIPTSLSSLFK